MIGVLTLESIGARPALDAPPTGRAADLSRRDLIERIAAGDSEALGRFYDETKRLAYGLALRILRDSLDAEDIVIEAYTQIWRNAGQFRPDRGTPQTWLLTIVRSRAIDRLRSQRTRQALTAPDSGAADQAAAPDPSAEAALIHDERAAQVRAALSQLPEATQKALLLAYFGGKSHSEIASELGEPLGTVKTRIRRGLQALRGLMEKEGA